MRVREFSTILLPLVVLSAAAKTIATHNPHNEETKDLVLDKSQLCPEEESTILDQQGRLISVRWPETVGIPSDISVSNGLMGNGVTSQPLCLSAAKEPLTRWCFQRGSSSNWYPQDPPPCDGGVQTTYKEQSDCPLPFKKLNVSQGGKNTSICILITEATKWSAVCSQYGNTISMLDLDEVNFEAVVKALSRNEVESSWLPAKRDEPFGPILIKLPGKRWGKSFKNVSDHKFVKMSRSWSLHDDCVSLNVDDLEVGTNNCSMKLPAVCVIPSPIYEPILHVSCPKYYFSLKHSIGQHNRCFKIYHNLTYPITWLKATEICNEEENGHLMEMSSMYDTFTYKELIKIFGLSEESNCWMSLKRKVGILNGFVWNLEKSKTKEVSFVNWNAEFAKDHPSMKIGTRGVVDTNGTWSLLPEYSTLKCFVCESLTKDFDTDMSLKFFPLSNKIRLRVYWPLGLWKESKDDRGFQCFTDSGGGGDLIRTVDTTEVWDKQWTDGDMKIISHFRKNGGTNINFDVHKKMYELSYDRKLSGNFWCEGHKAWNFIIEKSNTILVLGHERGHIYSVIIDVHGECVGGKDFRLCDPTFSDILRNISSKLENHITKCKTVTVIAKKLQNVFRNGTLRVLFHIQSPENNKYSNVEDYRQTFDAVKRTVRRYKQSYTLHSFLSSGGCPPDVTYEESLLLHWKGTQLGSTSVSRELCLDQDGIPVRRKCLGDFINGAVWDTPSGRCVNKNVSDITVSLHRLAVASENLEMCEFGGMVELVASLVKYPSSLNAADIYFVANIMDNTATAKWKGERIPQLTTIIQILNSVQQARSECVKLSQTFFNSTNIILDSVQRLMEKITTGSIYKNDGVLLSVTSQVVVQISDPLVSNVTGLVLLRNESKPHPLEKPLNTRRSFEDLIIKPLKPNAHSPEFLLNLKDLEVAVWVPEDVIVEYIKDGENNSWYDYPQDYINHTFSLPKYVKNKPKIIIVMFYNDLIFQNVSDTDKSSCSTLAKVKNHSSERTADESVVVTRVVSVSIPGYSPDLPVPIPIIFRPLVNISSPDGVKRRQCSFWDFTYNSSTPSSSFGGWSTEGCVYAGNSTVRLSRLQNISSHDHILDICVCTHLTHFSELVFGPQDRSTASFGFVESDIIHKKALDIITIVGCSLSLLGVLGIAITAISFRSWRQKPGTKILLQLSLALGIQMTIFILSSSDIVQSGYEEHPEECAADSLTVSYELSASTEPPHTRSFEFEFDDIGYDSDATLIGMKEPVCPSFSQTISCTIMGALLHYSVLSAFAWMLITALLQFFRYVKVLGATRPPRFFLKAMMFGWGVPIIPVVLVLAIAPSSYIPPSRESTLLCYPSRLPLVLGVLVPVGLTVLTNFVVYIMIIYSIMRIPDRKEKYVGSCPLIVQQLRLGVVLFFLLGLSWLFGLMAAIGAGFVFSYLFCVTATVQGFVLFLFFVVFDPSTRHLWATMMGTWKSIAVRASSSATDLLSSATPSSVIVPQKAIKS